MDKALEQARAAERLGEVPIGAILVDSQGKAVSRGMNVRETQATPLGHAELLAIHRAAKKLGRWRLTDLTLYVTLEPCVMCAGLLVQSRLKRVVYGARDPKGGGVESLYKILEDERLNHRVEITAGVRESECAGVLKDFFKRRRHENKQN